MRATQIDFKSLLPHVIQAYTEVFGEEYHELISDKINSSIIIPYNDIEGLEAYIDFRKSKKKEELIVKLLQQIGIIYDNPFHKIEDDIYYVADMIFSDIDKSFEVEYDDELPFRTFKYDGYVNDKIRLINFLRNYSKPEITEETLEKFEKTQEYNKLLLLIKKINKVYDILLKEYAEFEKELKSDLWFIANERKRENEIHQYTKGQMWPLLFPFIPTIVRDKIKDKSFVKQSKIVLGEQKLDEPFLIEYFSHDNINKLKSPNTPIPLKICIIRNQINFLKEIGCKIPNIDLTYRTIKSNIEKYVEFLNQDYIRQFIIPNEIIEYIKELRKRKNEEATKNFIMTREDIKNWLYQLGNTPDAINHLTEIFQTKEVCQCSATKGIDDLDVISIIFFTIRTYSNGRLNFSFVHELGHAIDQSLQGNAFEPINDYNQNENKNPYDNSFRKYERFNETINDIFTIEALKLLHKRNIFLIEPKEITDLSYNFGNTSFITQGLLKPLIEKFRKQVIKAKIFSQPKLLTEYIGKDNFEDLVDVINKVDFLTINGLTEEKIEKEPQDPMVIEYNKQLERLKRIYQSIDEYYTNYCSSLEEKEQKQNS